MDFRGIADARGLPVAMFRDLRWEQFSVAFNASGLVVAATTGDALIFTNDFEKGFILTAVPFVNTAFTYGMGSVVTATIGITGAVDKFHDSFSIATVKFPTARPKLGAGIETIGTEVRLYVTGGANLNTLTAGQVTIHLLRCGLP